MDSYSILIKNFAAAAKHTIFSPGSVKESEEKNENYYCHVLIAYSEAIMQSTYENFRLGLGIFSMQGIEQRNKELKTYASRFSNKRGNLCQQTIKRLFDLFFFGGMDLQLYL